MTRGDEPDGPGRRRLPADRRAPKILTLCPAGSRRLLVKLNCVTTDDDEDIF
jgi:hypothetical protein